jgi:hypothetical protein
LRCRRILPRCISPRWTPAACPREETETGGWLRGRLHDVWRHLHQGHQRINRIAQVVERRPLHCEIRGSNPSHDTIALLLGRHYEFPQCGIIKEKL